MGLQRNQLGSDDLISVRTLLLGISAVLMIIVGLLGMHTFSAGAFGHGAHAGIQDSTIAAEMTVSASSDTTPAGATVVQSAGCDGDCESSSTQPIGHSELMMACALALLVIFSFLLPAVAMYMARLTFATTFSTLWLKYSSRLPHPPSLIVLSISRT